MALLSKQQIIDADDRPAEEVEVPEWGGSVLVRGLTGEDRDAYFAAQNVPLPNGRTMQDISNATARLCARAIVDPEKPDEAMFTAGELAVLGRKSAAALERVGQVAARLSGLTEEDMAALGKDSASTQNGSSTSG
jgi:hypothetical protein